MRHRSAGVLVVAAMAVLLFSSVANATRPHDAAGWVGGLATTTLSRPGGQQAALSVFATGTGPTDWLNEVNRYREAAGLTPVTQQPAWTLGIQHHLVYMEKTPGEYFTGQYASLHTENPASPYYTEDGAREAGYCDLVTGGARNEVDAIDVWWRAPFHAIGMLRPALARVALGYSTSTGAAGLDVIQGLDYTLPTPSTPVIFPGPGVVTDLPTFGGEWPNPLETLGWTGEVGLPLIVMLPRVPDPGLTASLVRPSGPPETTTGGDLGVVDELNYVSSDPVYGPTGLAVLRGNHAVLLFPRHPLANGPYSVRVQQPGQPDIAWMFSVAGPLPLTTVTYLPAGWVNRQVTLRFSATQVRLGIASTEYRIDTGAWKQDYYADIAAPADHSNDGIHTVGYRSVDSAGNVEPEKTCEVRIDTAAPSTRNDAPGTWVAQSPVRVTLTASDDGSGVAATEYRLAGAANWSRGTIVEVAGDGVHRAVYRSVDEAGNVETTRTFIVRIGAKPSIGRLSPTVGRRGITVTLTGKNFRTRRGASYVKFGTTKVGKYVSWSSTRIKCKVPARAKFGRLKVTVTTAGGTSNARTFTVKR